MFNMRRDYSQNSFFVSIGDIVCVCVFFFSSLVNFSEYILVYFENMNVVLLFASFYFLWEGELINELFINLPYIFNVLNCVSVFYSGNTLHSDTHYTA